MTKKLLLRIAAFLTLFTFAGHTFGAISGPAKELPPESLSVYESMHYAMVNFPFGPAKSIYTIMYGANISVSVYLLVAGAIFLFLAGNIEQFSRAEKQILGTNSAGLVMMGIISFYCFFPLPAVCLGLAGIFGLIALSKK